MDIKELALKVAKEMNWRMDEMTLETFATRLIAALTNERNDLLILLDNWKTSQGVTEDQLAAAQAREAKLRGKLFHFGRHYSNCGWQMNKPCNCGFEEALSLPTDDSALMERLKEERERAVREYIVEVTGSPALSASPCGLPGSAAHVAEKG